MSFFPQIFDNESDFFPSIPNAPLENYENEEQSEAIGLSELRTLHEALSVSTQVSTALHKMKTFLLPYKENLSKYQVEIPKKILSQDDMKKATELLASVKSDNKLIETQRKSITAPVNEVIKKINNLCKEVTEPFAILEKQTKSAMSVYLAEQEMRQAKAQEEEQARVQEEQARLNAVAKEMGVDAPLVPELLQEERKTSTTRTASGTSYTKKSWQFELEDISKVPVEYLVLDTSKVKEAIKLGIREIAGLKIFEKTDIAIRS